jgi:maltose alpha-D-glucosyltransferase / alpha-amylase
VDGFRVDMAGSLVKSDPDGRATAALWHEFRAWMDREYPDRVMVSEWSEPAVAIPGGFHMDFLLPWNRPGYRSLFRPPDAPGCAFFDPGGRGSIRRFLDEFEPLYAATKGQGFIAIPTGNHDTVPRLGNGRGARDLQVAFAFLLTMPGVPFIYYGDEIGMRSPDGLPSKEGGFGRTSARTPMQWDAGPNAGFSTARAGELYLPVEAAADRPTVAAQEGDPASSLQAVRRLTALRRAHPALAASGDFAALVAKPGGPPFVYERAQGGERILVALNPSAQPVSARLPAAWGAASCRPLDGDAGALRRDGSGWAVALPGVSYAIVSVGP